MCGVSGSKYAEVLRNVRPNRTFRVAATAVLDSFPCTGGTEVLATNGTFKRGLFGATSTASVLPEAIHGLLPPKFEWYCHSTIVAQRAIHCKGYFGEVY